MMFLKSHPNLYLIALSSILSILVMFLLIALFNSRKPKKVPESGVKELSTPNANADLQAIAGDDIIATHLDLARAYIEINKKELAKTILESVMKMGDKHQQREAKDLMMDIS